jgi:hypothetical protein
MRKRKTRSSGLDSVGKDAHKKIPGWIGVDLDGTLAKSVAGQAGEEIGPPIHPMVQLVKEWLAHGENVRIFTARVNPNQRLVEAIRARRAIEAWSERHLGQILPVTYEKDWDMVLLFDDSSTAPLGNCSKISYWGFWSFISILMIWVLPLEWVYTRRQEYRQRSTPKSCHQTITNFSRSKMRL